MKVDSFVDMCSEPPKSSIKSSYIEDVSSQEPNAIPCGNSIKRKKREHKSNERQKTSAFRCQKLPSVIIPKIFPPIKIGEGGLDPRARFQQTATQDTDRYIRFFEDYENNTR